MRDREKHKEYMRKWHAEHREHDAQYRVENKEHFAAKNKEWAENNKDRVKTNRIRWRSLNADKVSMTNKRARERHPDRVKRNWEDYYAKHKDELLVKKSQHRKETYERDKAQHKMRMLTDPEYAQRVRARAAVTMAVFKGKLVKPSNCEACSKTARLHGHHHFGYEEENKLNVMWLCPECHGKTKHEQRALCESFA